MTTSDFVELWGEGEKSFDVPDDVVVVPKEPRLVDRQLSYSFDPVEAAVPVKAGPATLFIDPLAGTSERRRDCRAM